MRALVLDGNSRVTLAVVRSLGRRGCIVDCAEDAAIRVPLSFRSRHVRRRVALRRFPEPGEIASIVASNYDVVLATATRSLQALAVVKEDIEARGVRVPSPAAGPLRAANDKRHVGETCRSMEIATPETWAPVSREELEKIGADIPYPAIVKLRADEGADLSPAKRYRVVENAGELCQAWTELSRLQPCPIVQRRILGTGLGVGVLLGKGGELVAQFTHARERELPPRGGPSAACVSAHASAAEHAAASLLRAMGWTGVAMVEFRIERGSGKAYVLEVNPRLWGSVELAIRCGVDFPWLLCRWAMGERISINGYADGRRLRFLGMDAAATAQALRDPTIRWQYVRGFLRDLVASPPDGIFRPDDPSPGFHYVCRQVAAAVRRCASSL